MAKGLKGITVQIDGNTTPLNKALSSVNANARSLQQELKGVNSLLKLDPSNTELAAQKQKILTESIDETEKKLQMLTQAQKEAAAAGKDINDEGYRDLQREIVLTQQKLQDLKKEKSTFDELQKSTRTFGQAVGELVQKIPVVNKLAAAYTNVKDKVATAVKENEKVKKVSSYIDNAKAKVSSFAEKVPVVKKMGEAFGTVKEKASELASKMPSVTNALKSAGSAAAGMAANVAKIGFKAVGAAAVGAGAAVAALTTKAIQGYANFEQLVGGVETLFGAGGQSLEEYAQSVGKSVEEAKAEYDKLQSAQETVLKNADNAYKTAGMSANDYMETVTGFSAALIQSLEGDTEVAAQKADMAITDMSDNANKMGSSMESIQNAYQGFAKQNYTMLDNLKLGYGGTKEEMQRLLDDAQAISGIEYDISSYADVVDAIHVIQTEMGITGTTAKEASETIQGSITTAGAAWDNWLTGMADDDADFDQLTDNLIDSVLTVVDNILPRIISTVPRLVDGLGDMIQQLAGYVPSLLQDLLPSLMEGVTSLISTLVSMLPQLLGVLTGIIPQVVDIIVQMLPQLIEAGVQILTSLIQGITNAIPTLISTIVQMIPTVVNSIIMNLPLLVQAGLDLLVALISGIMQAIPQLIAMLPTIIQTIVTQIVAMLPTIIQTGITLLETLISGLVQAIPQLVAMLPTIIETIVTQIVSMLPQIVETGITLLTTLISGITQAIPQLIAMLPTIISTIVNVLIQNLPQIISSGIELIGGLISGLIQAIPSLVAAIPQIVTAIFDTFKAINWGELGTNIIDGVITGVKNAASSLIEVFKDLASSALDAVKEFFGIASPSRVMRDEVGKMLPAGMAVGVEEGMDEEEDRIQKAMRKGVPTTIDSYINITAGNNKAAAVATQTAPAGFTQNVTINSPKELSPSETARQTRNATRQMVLKLKPT